MEPAACWGRQTSKWAVTVLSDCKLIFKTAPAILFLLHEELHFGPTWLSAMVLYLQFYLSGTRPFSSWKGLTMNSCPYLSPLHAVSFCSARSPVTSVSPNPVCISLTTTCSVSEQLHPRGNHSLPSEDAFLLSPVSPHSWLFYLHLPYCFSVPLFPHL